MQALRGCLSLGAKSRSNVEGYEVPSSPWVTGEKVRAEEERQKSLDGGTKDLHSPPRLSP